MQPGISVIICCFNSASRIGATLQHLVTQKNISLSSWEVIIVDNGSTDKTAENATLLWESFDVEKPTCKIVFEPIPGLSSARKKGINAAIFKYVLFCDDDNWLEENYLSDSLNIMQSSPQIGALGGTGSPVFEDKEPPYFWINQFHALAVGNQSDVEGDITDGRGVVYGAGMVLNKAAFTILQEKYQFQFLLSDRIGNNLVSSGDHELCLALRKIGYRIFCSYSLKFKHFIPKQRTTIHYYKKLFLGFGISYAMLHVYRVNKENLNSIKNDYRYICLRCVKNIISTRIVLLFNGYYFGNNRYKYIDQLHKLYKNLGALKTFKEVKNLYKLQYAGNTLFNERNAVNEAV